LVCTVPCRGDGSLFNTFEVYPNPASINLTIQTLLPVDENTVISFYDFTGRKIAADLIKVNETNFSINVANWSQGVYTILMQSADNSQKETVVITK
jgi:hypothetical protein